MIEQILALSPDIRYVAIYDNGVLESASRAGTGAPSADESDRYEELLVNPTLLKLASQRGNIDCGGLDYLLIRYGSFFQLVFSRTSGHVSVCIEKRGDPITLEREIRRLVAGNGEEV